MLRNNVRCRGHPSWPGCAVQIGKCFGANPSPEGRGWCEAPGEGCKDSSLHPSPAASRHPLPSGEDSQNAYWTPSLVRFSSLVNLDGTAHYTEVPTSIIPFWIA